MRRLPCVVVALSVVFSAACAPGPPGEGRRGSRGSGSITREELASLSQFSAFDVVRRLRPQWLHRRGTVNLDRNRQLPVVFVDRTERGDIRELERIPADDVERISYLSARDATTRFGTGYTRGVIEVISRGN
ncbi:MAG: hypothetical protein BMS9Abin29_0853 [Gemmatimonadota bacterium]|nr:MAG: hypothetical protein BMS9Abin29_0853 [Gemmatimonadota bacterium]